MICEVFKEADRTVRETGRICLEKEGFERGSLCTFLAIARRRFAELAQLKAVIALMRCEVLEIPIRATLKARRVLHKQERLVWS